MPFSLYVLFILCSTQALAFHFSFNPPSQCDDLGLTWIGGTPPFTLLIIPVFGTPRQISIPESTFSNGNGSYSMQLPFNQYDQVLFTMSDSTGFNTGGSSNVYTVLQSKGGVCNTTDPGTAFVFQLNSDLQQCGPFVFSGYDGAVPPVTIDVVIPGGTALTMSPPSGQSSYTWTVNAAHGTSMIFLMTDSQGNQGGSSNIRSVGPSDDSSCLNNSSPSTTTDAPGPTQPSSALPSSSATSASPVISAASIAGVIIGSVLFLAVVITLALFVLKRSKGSKKHLSSRVDLTANDAGSHTHLHGVLPYGSSNDQIDLDSYLRTSRSKYAASEVSYPDPTPYPSPLTLYPPQPCHLYSPHTSIKVPASPSLQESDFDVHANASATLTAQPKALSMGIPPSKFILHTDVEDASPYEGGFIELPPQYSERRGPGKSSSPAVPRDDTKQPL